MPQKKVYECYCKGDSPSIQLMIPNILLYAMLAAPFNNLSSALAGAAKLSRPKQKPSKHQAQRRHFGPFLLQEKD
jgi:hypothetical protein